jgi:hypothetical protein
MRLMRPCRGQYVLTAGIGNDLANGFGEGAKNGIEPFPKSLLKC